MFLRGGKRHFEVLPLTKPGWWVLSVVNGSPGDGFCLLARIFQRSIILAIGLWMFLRRDDAGVLFASEG